MTGLTRFRKNQTGASAVEFALIVPLFTAMVFGLINLCIVLWAAAALHFTVDAAARCMSVLTNVCTNATATQNYAKNHYVGPGITNTNFVATTLSTCGNQVSITTSTTLYAIIVNPTVNLSAKSCFPVQD